MGKGWMIRAFRDAGDSDNTNAGAAVTSLKTPKLPPVHSPRSPFSSIFKNTLRLSRSSCGVCMQTLKFGHGMAIYTAECSHGFHFSCVVSHVRERTSLVCPVCGVTWKDAPFLAIHTHKEAALMETPKKNRNSLHPHFIEQVGITSYADDEPLMTPQVSRALEDYGDDVEEFRGFFVNPISSSHYPVPGDSMKLEFSFSKEAAVISRGPTHSTYAVVLKVKAPGLPPKRAAERRAPIDLVAVLDVGEGMAGAKLRMLKRSMLLILSSLSSADRLCIVAFTSAPKKMMPLTRMTENGQRLAQHIIKKLSCGHGASVEEALKHATQVLDERRERNPVASVILLSGGYGNGRRFAATNKSRRWPEDVSFTRFAHVEIPVNYPEPAENTVSKCLGGLLSVVVKDLRIQLALGSGSDPGELTAVYPLAQTRAVFGPNCIRLGDMYAEEGKELLVEIRTPASVSRVGLHQVIVVNHHYKDPITQESIKGGDRLLVFPRVETVQSGGPKIEWLRNTFISHRAVAESFRLIERGAIDQADQLLSTARALLLQSGADPTGEWIENLEAQLEQVKLQQKCRVRQNYTFS